MKLFSLSQSLSSVRLLSSGGICPLKLFQPSIRVLSSPRFPSSAGSGPCRLFEYSHKSTNFSTFPIAAEMLPSRFCRMSLMLVTRKGDPPSSKPVHCLTGLVADQFKEVEVPLRVSREPSSVSQS